MCLDVKINQISAEFLTISAQLCVVIEDRKALALMSFIDQLSVVQEQEATRGKGKTS